MVTLAIPIYQLNATLQHDKVSVKPFLNFFYELDDDDKQVGLSVENVGAGPAIIKDCKIYVDNQLVESWDDASDKGNLIDYQTKEVALEDGDVLGVGKTIFLYSYSTKHKNREHFIDFVADHVGVVIKYCSSDSNDECPIKCSSKGKCGLETTNRSKL